MFGERNTGTNYLRKLIDDNLDIEQLNGVTPYRLRKTEWARDLYFFLTGSKNLGWKHSMPPSGKKINSVRSTVGFVTLVKNPYSWLLSLYRNPYHNFSGSEGVDFVDFVKSPWHSVHRERSKKVFTSPVEIWNLKNNAYTRLAEQCRSLNFRYEDLLADPKTVVRTIAREFRVSWKHEMFENTRNSTKDKNLGFDYYQDYYLNEKWREKLDQESIEEINQRIDKELAEKLGYCLIERLGG